MAINILTQNITSDDYVSKGAKNNMKKHIRKELLDISDDNITLEHLRKIEENLLSKYLVDDKDNDRKLSFSLDRKNDKLFISIKLDKTPNQDFLKRNQREKLKKRIRDKALQKKNMMTQRQYLAKVKEEKKMLRKDPRVKEEMIIAFNKLRTSIPNAQFPNPIEVLDNKEEHVQNLMRYVAMVYKTVGEEKVGEMFKDNDYVNYISVVLGFEPKLLINKIIEDMKNYENSQKKVVSDKMVDSDNVEDIEVDSDNVDEVTMD